MSIPFHSALPRIFAAVALAAAVAIPSAAQTAAHEKSFGVETGWISRNGSAIAGLAFQYTFTPHFRLAADADIALRNKDKDALLIDVNAHFPFRMSPTVEIYPLAGADYSSWAFHRGIDDDTSDDVTTRVSRFGLNAGAGVGCYVSSTLKVTVEARCTLVKSLSSVRLAAGIAYVF